MTSTHTSPSAEPIRNRVAEGNLQVLALESLLPSKDQCAFFDLSAGLEQGFILREKPFRAWVSTLEITSYHNKYVAIGCATDAILPPWAFMLVTTRLSPYVAGLTLAAFEGSQEKDPIHQGLEEARKLAFRKYAEQNNWKDTYQDARVMIKGCTQDPLAAWAYVVLSEALLPHVRSLMYGEPCSSVPIYKAPPPTK